MKKIIFFLLAASSLMISCKDKKQTPGNENPEHAPTADLAKDSAEIRAVITSFYNWYDANYAKLMKYDLYSGIKKEDQPPYKINWNEVEKYQRFIRDSIPQLGDEFLKNQKRFFEQCDSAFKKDVEDDIPYGFDYDWYTNSQEETRYTTDVVRRDQPWPMLVEGDHAKVRVPASYEGKDTLLVIYMKKENGNWTITKIGDN